MNNNLKNNLKISAIISYVFAGLYSLVAAWTFSLDQKIYWLFFAFLCICMINGILVSAIGEKQKEGTYLEKHKKYMLVYTIISIISPISFVLNLLNYLDKNITIATAANEQPEQERPTPNTKPLCRKKYLILTIVSLCIILVFSFVASVFQTSGFGVEITHFTLTKEMTEQYNSLPIEKNGKSIGGVNIIEDPMLKFAVDVYRPKNVDKSNPAPVVFVLPGFTRTKETQAQYCIELSRRGFVVICSDPGQQGGTTASGYDYNDEGELVGPLGSTVGNNGVDYLWQYVYNNTEEFDYIDRDRIGTTGHSAGGGDIVKAAAKFAGNTYEESVIKALYCSGYIKTSAANVYKNLRCNAAMSYAYYDEGNFRYQTSNTSLEVISLRFINEVFNGTTVKGNNHTEAIYEYAYGDMADGSYRIVRNERTNHCFEVFDKTSVANAISFFVEALGADTDLSSFDQIWWGKEFSTGIALVGAFMLVISLSGLLITTPFFKSLRAPAPKRIKKQNTSDKIIFWSSALITAVIACLDYIPFAHLSTIWFADAAANVFTFFFPARMFNAVLLWAVFNGLIGLVIFFGTYFAKHWLYEKIAAKNQGREPVYDFEQLKSLQINFKDLLKTLLLATILFSAFYLMSHLTSWIFNTDFRFMMISSGTINWRFFVTWLMYFPLVFIFYIANSIRVNMGITFENWKEWKIMLVGGLLNSVGILFILIINYIAFFKTGTVYYGYYGNPQLEVWLYINMLFPLVVMMFILPIFNRIFYKQTNRVYLGAITNVMIFVMMTLLASVSYIPL